MSSSPQSSANSPAARRILVTGDVSYDYNLYLPTADGGRQTSRFSASLGGAAISMRLLEEVRQLWSDEPHPVLQTAYALPDTTAKIAASRMAGLWHLHDAGSIFQASSTDTPCSKIWRLQRSLALGQADDLAEAVSAPEAPPAGDAKEGDILLINDDAAGFRHHRPHADWPAILEKLPSSLKWVVLKMTAPLCVGDLWWSLSMSPAVAERLVVIVTAGDLRKHEARVGEAISWEQSAIEVAHELLHSPDLAGLRQAKQVIVTLKSEGALILSRQGQEWSGRLVFDPLHMEGEWPDAVKLAGEAYGFTACMAAAVTVGLTTMADGDLAPAVKRGLAACRLLRAMGHGPEQPGKEPPQPPYAAMAGVLAGIPPKDKDGWKAGNGSLLPKRLGHWGTTKLPPDMLACAAEGAGAAGAPGHRWRIMEQVEDRQHRPGNEPLYGVGRRVAVFGIRRGLLDAPIARFGGLVTADRDEIESLRNIRRLLQGYKAGKAQNPLSLAVFGPPGAGKSFAVKEIARGVLGDAKPLVFNLSQFKDADALVGAFHQVRDRVLGGGIPLVFWDEFDAKDGEWLQFFLAPMQDGSFLEGQITHPIGRCVFVFAGATSYTFSHFAHRSDDPEWRKQFQLRKGPDFVSRLQGYLNVLGPNRRLMWKHSQVKQQPDWQPDQSDICFPVRRALFLRSWMGLTEKREDERLEIDHGLLRALLEVREYRHGTRSMERIVRCCQASGGPFGRSALPPDELLDLDTDAGDFRRIMCGSREFEVSAEALAPVIHEFYRELCRKNGWPVPYDMPYAQLPEPGKASNLAAARRIPWILGLAGLYLVPGNHPEDPQEQQHVEELIKANIETMAEEEHDLWMRFLLAAGWTKGDRDDPTKRHNRLVPYATLPEGDKEKDRNSVFHFAEIARRAGYRIVRRKPEGPDLA